jgi:putative lipase involved disintegration of autophagic bodies
VQEVVQRAQLCIVIGPLKQAYMLCECEEAQLGGVKVKVLHLVDQLTADASKERPWDVFVTGHSLGGALATLCAYDLAGCR